MAKNWTEADLMQLQARQFKHSKIKPASEQLREAIIKANSKAPSPTEDIEQVNLIQWLRLKGIRHNATPNGGHRHKATAGKLKAQGVVAGFPDLTIWPDLNYEKRLPVLMIEMKRTHGGSLSAEQKEWAGYFGALMALDYPVRWAVCKGFDEARKFITEAGY